MQNIKINFNNGKETTLEPLEKLWNEIRHTQSTITFLKALLEDPKANKHYVSHWEQEVANLRDNLNKLQKDFSVVYLQAKVLVEEFEIKKYNRTFLEISFLKA